jgi:alkylation response protein AidB-like acyl-CoA dehydrogenase
VADEGIILGSTGAEAIVTGDWTTPTTATRDSEGYRITGRKFFCSQAPAMSLVRVMARDVDTNELLICGVPADAPGVSIVETWDTAGMRATASHDVVFEDVFIPEAAVGARLPAGAPMRTVPMAGVATWFLSLVSGVYIGIADEARAEAYRALGTGVNSTYRDQALTDVLVGQMEADFLAARATRDDVVGRLDSDRSDYLATLPSVVLCKEIVTEKAAAVVDKAVQLAGGRAYFRKSPLERLARDVRAGRFHPPSSPQSFQLAGERLRETRVAR